MIPLVDLKKQYDSIKSKIDNAIKEVLINSSFIGGNAVTEFENNFAKYLVVNHCISCANGTDSLEILLKALEIGKDDEVIIPAVSWISTSEAVSSVGAKPVFVDINSDYYTIDITKIEAKITNNTKAIIPVHLYGQPVDMIKLMAIAKKHNLKVIEDCAQAHGAEFNNKKIGSFGDCASFSFYPGKNLGAYGDAGAMVTNDTKIAEKARMIANHGQKEKHNHIIEGRNSRMDGIHAAVLNIKLKYLEKWTQQRIINANHYSKNIKANIVIKPKTIRGGKHVFHLYVIRTKKRKKLISYLKANGVSSAIHYPIALPFLKCYEYYNHKENDFPVSYKLTKEILSIPMFPELGLENIEYISKIINEKI